MDENGENSPDPLHRLLDAVLDERHPTLGDMAGGAFLSPFHFTRQVSGRSGESPLALRRRVLLEQAAWRIQRGTSVTDAAFAAGYDSVEGFSRAFRRAYGHAPSDLPSADERGHWLPSPNGLHFHSPTALYVDAGTPEEVSAGDVVGIQVRHDLEDIDALLEAAGELGPDELARVRLPGSAPRGWDGADETIGQLLRHVVLSKEPWLASIEARTAPDLSSGEDPGELRKRHREIGARWLALVRDIQRRDAWQDRIIDALCDPPESFLLSQIVAHELTFSAHRRLLARWMLADAGVDLSAPALDPDPILWHRRTTGEQPL
ncbi:helix-turn-helix domain-containing protein [Brachybacterium sp. GCM10030252]|uniref:helix-turn-helix domain-containing protein n=1 Tax=Brachybacterium sp. GCM10030252 TaxID=3273380 RepID=UPI00361BE045